MAAVNRAGRKAVSGVLRRVAAMATLYFILLAGAGDSLPGVVLARAASSTIVISQVYGGGGNKGAIHRNDFIELFNQGTTAVDVTGWSVQYASAAGTDWQVTALSGSIRPGRYYLVEEAAGGVDGTISLPTPDATGSINMSATSAKVALLSTTTALSGTGCPFAAGVEDFIGYGGASCFEGSAPALTLSNTVAALRNAAGCMETDSNAADFAPGAPNPRNSSTTGPACVGGRLRSPAPSPSLTASPGPSPIPSPSRSPLSDEHLTMGNPSNATADAASPFNYLMTKPQYALAYHRDAGRPNWVSWHLDATWLGIMRRRDDFRPDTALPAGWYQVQSTDYSSSGFDRGHHTPSGDRTSSSLDNSATFLMTNMMPQAPDNNQGPWAQLEIYCRTLVHAGNELYIITGGAGAGGTGSNGGVTTTIAGGRVTVPAFTWKVILVLPVGDNDVMRVNKSTRVIAVIMPNIQGIKDADWRSYRVNADAVETLTGYDFFSNVPVLTQQAIERRVDNQ